MDDHDRTVRDIGLIWDNDHATHIFINECVRTSDSWQMLSSKLQMFYNDAIDRALKEVPESWIGHQLIRQQVDYHSRDVFDDLARGYWDEAWESCIHDLTRVKE